MTLHVEHNGQGHDIVLIHGWGLHSGIWQALVKALASDYRVTTIDLPGHGKSTMSSSDYTLDNIATQIAPHIPDHSTVIGWSLGGMVAQQLASQTATKIKQLILVASSPQFVASEDWLEAMTPEVLDGFAAALKEDYQTTLQRFISLQALGTSSRKETLKALRAQLDTPPHPDALTGGLNILREANLRASLNKIDCPSCFIFGQHDKLVPQAASQAIQQLLPDAPQHIIKGAGHAPFISHPDAFLHIIKDQLPNQLPDQ